MGLTDSDASGKSAVRLALAAGQLEAVSELLQWQWRNTLGPSLNLLDQLDPTEVIWNLIELWRRGARGVTSLEQCSRIAPCSWLATVAS